MINKIYIFDVDDTLIDTKACIRAVDKYGNIVFKAGTKTFNAPDSTEQLLRPGLTWDFTEFESLEQIRSEKLLPAFSQLRVAATTGQTIYIMTARQRHDVLKEWLTELIDMQHVEIICYDGSIPKVSDWKAQQTADIIMIEHPDKVVLFEDDFENINAISQVCQRHGVGLEINN